MKTVTARTKGARRRTNPECEYAGRWLVPTMVLTKNGKLLCRGRGCHTIYEPREVIDDPENEDYRLWVKPVREESCGCPAWQRSRVAAVPQSASIPANRGLGSPR